jgi:hypothetical protein
MADIALGVLMLDAQIPRPLGDVGNPSTFGFRVLYEMVPGATAESVVEREPAGLLDRFVAAGRRLVDRGAAGVVTTCGFLAILQDDLAAALPVPLLTSSLMQIPMVLRSLPGSGRVCVVTANATRLTARHLAAAGISAAGQARVALTGLEDVSAFYPCIVGGDGSGLDVAEVRRQITDRCVQVLERDPSIGAFVFECANLPPYAAAVRDRTGLPVWDAVTMTNWLYAALCQAPLPPASPER